MSRLALVAATLAVFFGACGGKGEPSESDALSDAGPGRDAAAGGADGEPSETQGDAAAAPSDGEVAGSEAFLHQDGLRIVDEDGNPVALKGINLGGWLMWEGWIWGGILNPLDSGRNAETHIQTSLANLVGGEEAEAFRQSIYRRFIAEKDIERIAGLGYNAVRVPFNHRLLEDDSEPFVYRDQGWEILDALLGWCAGHGVYAVLDLHSAPGGQSEFFVADPDATSLWESEENEQRTISLWRAIAERYRDRPWLAGYDLLNEPRVILGQRLVDLYSRIIAAIREVDERHMVFLEGNWNAVIFDMFTARPAENVVYSFHMYAFSGRDLDQDLASFVALAQRQQVPLWAGEYGEESAEWVASMTDTYASTPEIAGWAPWTWKRSGTGNPVAQELVPPLAWRGVIGWITAPDIFTRKPTTGAARAAMAAFLDAADLDECVEDAPFIAGTQ